MTRNKKDNLLYCNKMHVGRSKYLGIATMVLVATMLLQSSYVQAENPQNLLVKVTAKNFNSVTVVKVENSKDNIYNIKLVWFTLQNGVIQSFKSADGWSAETASNSNTVQFRTDTNPVKPGESVSFGITSDQKNPIFKWIVLNEAGDQIGSGILDVAKEAGEQEKSGNTGSNGTTAPQNLQATPGNAQITLSWSAPASNGGSAITNYNVYKGTSSGQEIFVVQLGNVLTYTDTSVTNEVMYYYQVTAVNSVGESAKSNEASANVEKPNVPTVPTVPPEIRVKPEVLMHGHIVKMIGAGFTPDSKTTVLFDGKQIKNLSVDANGKIKGRILLPKGVVDGAHQISVSDTYGRAANISMTVKEEEQIIQLIVNVERQSYKQGELVKITGTGKPGAAVQITVNNPTNVTIISYAVSLDKDGKYSAFIPLNEDATPGHYKIIAFQDQKTVNSSFDVLTERGSQITVVTDKFEYKQGENMKVSGKATPNKDVNIRILAPDGSELFNKVVKTDSNSTYTVSVPISPAFVLGKYSAVVKVDTEEISITFTIVQGSVKLTVQIEKQQYRTGELVRITGKGKANDKISITIKAPEGEPIKMSASTKDDGSYSALWLVPTSATGGTYRVSATQGDATAETGFAVLS